MSLKARTPNEPSMDRLLGPLESVAGDQLWGCRSRCVETLTTFQTYIRYKTVYLIDLIDVDSLNSKCDIPISH